MTYIVNTNQPTMSPYNEPVNQSVNFSSATATATTMHFCLTIRVCGFRACGSTVHVINAYCWPDLKGESYKSRFEASKGCKYFPRD